jgi:hypothetical protein
VEPSEAPETPAGEAKPVRARRKATPADGAPDTPGEASTDAAAAAPKRTRKSPVKKGEA